MHSAIKPAFKAKAVGQALTVQLSKGDLVDPLKALEMGQPGDIIVVDAGGDTETSVCGGLMGGLAKNRGIRGMIVDGAGRDIDELEDIGWPIWTRAITAARHAHHVLRSQGGALDQRPVSCGGITVHPGDFVVADTIGVAVVPLAEGRGGRANWRRNRPSASRPRGSGCRRARPSKTCWPSSAGFSIEPWVLAVSDTYEATQMAVRSDG